ncbi:hypothetical protein FE257_000593 [Aspergillus nanangensis]|uniref:Major facilitator superfamily (MFS) profile domain-containing protein n=1 Tax=Aspergillus nanangensis TaxID=2582783 RepID=A0AAD4CFC2_ASPNN|nr:hypothetical protein FE257_000593 [Aspergillus nanangensis]
METKQENSLSAPPHTIFDTRQKRLIVATVTCAGTFSLLVSNIYFPAMPAIADDLNVSTELVSLTVTSFLIFQGLAPSVWGPLSDVKGRRVAYTLTLLLSLAASIGLAVTNNYPALLILRCLLAAGCASTTSIGSGVVGDITTSADRGGYMGVFQGGSLISIAVGPVIGGAMSGSPGLGWHGIFWFLAIYTGVLLLSILVLLPETLRLLVSNGSHSPGAKFNQYPLKLYQRLTTIEWQAEKSPENVVPPRIDMLGPVRILFTRYSAPIILFFSVYYATWQMTMTAMSSLFKERYGMTELQIGLAFIANGVGAIIGTIGSGKLLNKDFNRVEARFRAQNATTPQAPFAATTAYTPGFPLETARLRMMPIYALLQCMSILLYGWTVHFSDKVPIAIPIIATFITGWTAVSNQSITTTYLVDIFPGRNAASTAALNITRCLMAAGGTAAVTPLIDACGIGWTFTICVAVQAVALVGLAVQWRFAGKWRARQFARVDS